MNSLCATIVFAVLLKSFHPVDSVMSKCSNDSIPIDCSCFHVTVSTDNFTWETAKQRCRSKDNYATLATIKSGEDNNIFEQQLNGNDSWVAKARGMDGRNSTLCKAIGPANVWTARNCGEKHLFICRKPVKLGCPSGWNSKQFQSSKNLCYWLSKTARSTFEEARQKCIEMNATLAEISTKEEYEFVRKQLFNETNNTDAWFGLQKAVNDTQYKYLQSSVPNYETLGVRFRRPGESLSSKKYCVTMEIGRNEVSLYEKKCDVKLHSYICQTEMERDFNIEVTNVNETSANISWSVQPSKCGLSRNTILNLLIRTENELKHSTNITNGDSWLLVNALKPETQYEIKITGNNITKRAKTFKTAKIRNHLQLLTNISTNDVHAKIDTTVNLLCAARGEPLIKFRWEKDKKTIPSYVETEKPYRSSILLVRLVNQTSYGVYICHVHDRFSTKSHRILITDLPKDDNDDQDWFVIAIVVLAVAVAILVIITVCLVYCLRGLERKLQAARKAESVRLKNVTIKNKYDTPLEMGPNKAINDELNDDDAERYAALNRAGNDEEDNFYTPLNEAPMYVNASEFKTTT